MSSPWVEIDGDDHWDRFEDRFAFRLERDRGTGAAITEPHLSVTFDLKHLVGSVRFEATRTAIDALALAAFSQLIEPGRTMVFLDWQHPTYRFDPHELTGLPHGTEPNEFPPTNLPPVFPDGDYYIAAADDLRWGTFGHPWERSLCIWGEPLVRTLGASLSGILPVLREHS